MEGLQAIGFLPLLGQSLQRFLIPLLLVVLAAPHFETLVATLRWHARPAGRFLQGPALAFLLLNCVVVTIMARSKPQPERRRESRGHDRLEAGFGWGKEDEQGNELAEENPAGEQSHDRETPATNNGYDHEIYKKKGVEIFLRRSWSLNASYKSKINNDLQVRANHVNEKKPIRRARIASRRNDKVGLPPNKPLSCDPKEPQLTSRGGLVCSEAGSQHAQKPPPLNIFDTSGHESCMKGDVGCAGQGGDHYVPVPAAATTTTHPSMDEVWAAIMSANKREERMVLCTQAEKRRKEPNSQEAGKPPKRQPAGAQTAKRTQPEAATPRVLPAAVLHGTSPCAAGAAAASALTTANTATNPTRTLSKAPATAAEQHKDVDGTDRENDQELEKLNRRAEEFIARFNCQMRLQRKASLQRQKRGHRPCSYAHLFQPSARGLLVG